MLSWKRADLAGASKRLTVAFIAVGIGIAATVAIAGDGPFFGIIGVAAAVWLGASTLIELSERIKLVAAPGAALGRLLRQPRATWGMTLAHLGLALAIAGMAGAGGWKTERIQVMKPGDTVNVAGYDFTFEGASRGRGPNYTIIQGTFRVTRDGAPVVVLNAEKRNYPVRQMPTTEAAIHTLMSGDLYAVVGDPEGDSGGYVTRIYFNPLVVWMWIGSLLMVTGGVVSISDRRYRVGAPSARQTKSTAPASA